MKKKLAAVFILALVLRLGMVALWYETGQGSRISSDAQGYHGLAQSLVAGKGFRVHGEPNFRRLPLYPLFIALCLPGAPYPLGVQCAQAFLGAFSCVILFAMGREMFGANVGLLASAIMGLDYLSIRATTSILAETLLVFFLLTTFYLLFRAEKTKNKSWLAGAGLTAGLTLLTKDNLFLFFPLIALWLLVKDGSWKTGLTRSAFYLTSLLLVIVPWVVHHSLTGPDSVAVTRGIGHILYVANNPQATGGTTGGDWELGRDSMLPWHDNDLPLQATVAEWDRYLFRRAVKFIREKPGSFFALTGRKIINMWRPTQTDSPPLARWAQALSYIPVVILGFAGIFLSANRWREFFPVYLLIAYVVLFHGVLIAHIRYRFPVMPFFMVFAAFTLVSTYQKWTVAHANPVNE